MSPLTPREGTEVIRRGPGNVDMAPLGGLEMITEGGGYICVVELIFHEHSPEPGQTELTGDFASRVRSGISDN